MSHIVRYLSVVAILVKHNHFINLIKHRIMKKVEIIWKVVFIVMLITSVVLFILDGNHLAAWVVNAVLYCFMLWQMFSTLCNRLNAIEMGVRAILFGKLEEVVIAKKADDVPKAEADPEQK